MRRRFFVEQFEGDRALMRGDAAHHVGHVLRAQMGQVYELSDGRRVRLGRVAEVGRERVEFELLEYVTAYEPNVSITLLLSVVKFDAFEWALEKATELGVARVVPLSAGRSEKALVQAAAKRAARWEKILLEAAQQSRRVKVPRLEALQRPEAAFSAAIAEVRLMLSERPDAPGIREVLEKEQPSEERSFASRTSLRMTSEKVPAEGVAASANTAVINPGAKTALGAPSLFLPSSASEDPDSKTESGAPAERGVASVALAIGPEGGWTDEELVAAEKAGFQPASLGHLILRAETAVTAALAIVNYAVESS